MKAVYDPQNSDAPVTKTENAIGPIINVRATPGDPNSAADHTKRPITEAEITAGEVDYHVHVSPKFGDVSSKVKNGVAIIDLVIELATG